MSKNCNYRILQMYHAETLSGTIIKRRKIGKINLMKWMSKIKKKILNNKISWLIHPYWFVQKLSFCSKGNNNISYIDEFFPLENATRMTHWPDTFISRRMSTLNMVIPSTIWRYRRHYFDAFKGIMQIDIVIKSNWTWTLFGLDG